MNGSIIKKEDRNCLANESASAFIKREKWEKDISTKIEEICLISLTILKIFLICMSFLIAQMCIVLSKNNQSFGSPSFTAERRPDRRAIASAMRGELTNPCVAAPWLMQDLAESVRIHVTLSLFDRLSQAASDLQVVTVRSSIEFCRFLS